MFKQIHVYDLDGTLIDSNHRYKSLPNGKIDLDYWFAHHHRINEDTLLPLAKQYKRDIADPETYVVICTLRSPHPLDLQYIREYLGMPNKLIMNSKNEKENLNGFKRRELVKVFNLRQFKNLPRYFWEDSKTFIDNCRDMFTRCYHVTSTQEFTA